MYEESKEVVCVLGRPKKVHTTSSGGFVYANVI